MSRAQVPGWQAEGFSIQRDVYAASEIDVLGAAIESANLARSRAGARHLLAIPSIAAAAFDARLMKLAEDALGCTPVPFGATLFDKTPESNWLVAWHQDTALPLMERREAQGWGPWSEKSGRPYAHVPASVLEGVVALRLHLDDSSSDNGPLRVLPGTHTRGVLTESQIRTAVLETTPVACTVGRGGVVRMRPLLVHASSKVVSAAPRRVLHFEYAAKADFGSGLRLHAGVQAATRSP